MRKIARMRLDLGIARGGSAEGGVELKSAEERMARERAEQEELMSGLVGMAGALKDSVGNVHADLQSGMGRLDAVEEVIGANAGQMSKSQAALAERTRQSWTNFCQQFFLLIIMLVMFFATFLVMKVVPKPV